VDARSLPVQALHHLTAVLGSRRVLPHLRHRRRAGALPGRARPAAARHGRIAPLGFTHLQFEALLTAARESASDYDFALVAMLGLLGLRIFEATGADIADLGEEHGHRVLRVCGKGSKVVLVPLPPAVGRAIDRAVADRTRGPILLNRRGARMDRHAATRRLRHLAQHAGVRIDRPHPHMLRHTFVTTMPVSMPASICATSRSTPGTPMPARPCAMTGPARPSTGTRTTSSPPTWPPAPDRRRASAPWPGQGRRLAMPNSGHCLLSPCLSPTWRMFASVVWRASLGIVYRGKSDGFRAVQESQGRLNGMRLRPGGSRRASGRTARRRFRRLSILLAVTVTITSVIGYVALSFTINGPPSYQPSTGWVAVLQPVTAPNVDTVQLLVQATTQGSQTRAAYDVAVCGPRPYTGDLLIGGSARLTAIQSYARVLFPGSPTPSLQVRHIPDLVFSYLGVIDLGPVQLIRIRLPYVSACPPATALSPSSVLPGGSSEGVVGMTAGPVQQSWAGWWNWWHGPHASQAWPLTGTIPGVPLGVAGSFPALRGLTGNWDRPLDEYVQVSAVGVPLSWSVDSAVPPASGPDPLLWQSRDPISPIVRLTDSSFLALLQNLLVIFAVVFGITASLVASLLFERLRSLPHQVDTGDSSRSQFRANPIIARTSGHPRPTSTASVAGRWVAVAGTVILISYARSRLIRSRHRSAPKLPTPDR
jgi:integrase/recombinase XerD